MSNALKIYLSGITLILILLVSYIIYSAINAGKSNPVNHVDNSELIKKNDSLVSVVNKLTTDLEYSKFREKKYIEREKILRDGIAEMHKQIDNFSKRDILDWLGKYSARHGIHQREYSVNAADN